MLLFDHNGRYLHRLEISRIRNERKPRADVLSRVVPQPLERPMDLFRRVTLGMLPAKILRLEM